MRGDLLDRVALADLVQGADTVLHIAGAVNAADFAGFHACNVEGTERVVEAARAAGIARFVQVSSLSAREPGLSDYGRSKYLAEEVVQASGLDWVIVRPPAIYGPRDREILELFRTAARWGVVPMPPRGRASVIAVSDLARLLLALACAPGQLTGAIVEPDDGRQAGWSHRDLGKAIGRAVGRRVWVPHVPASVLHLAARADRLLRKGGAKLTPDRARYMAHPDWVCSPSNAVPEAFWRPEVDTAEGLAATARWYRAQGWL
ncbi:epimerase [Altererythrobacter sp. B11]|nr:epimerase [Altererythrobacter sp. B11]